MPQIMQKASSKLKLLERELVLDLINYPMHL